MEMQKSKMFKLKKECMWQCKLQLILSMKICALCMTHAPWLPDHDSCAMRHTMPAMHSLATSTCLDYHTDILESSVGHKRAWSPSYLCSPHHGLRE